MVEEILEHPDEASAELLDSLGPCERSIDLFAEECADIDVKIAALIKDIDVIQRLRTIPGVGELVSAKIYAAIGDITRFPNLHRPAAYAGLLRWAFQTDNPSLDRLEAPMWSCSTGRRRM